MIELAPNKRPVICGFAASLGERREIVANAADGLSEAAYSVLRATGLQYYRVVDDLEPHVLNVITASLARADITPEAVDCVIIATKRDYPGAEAMNRDIQEVLVNAGITGATIFGLDRIACANAVLAMCLGNMLVSQGTFRNCLVLSYNKMRPEESRLMKPTVGYLSEGAAACVVTSATRRGYHIGTPAIQSDLMLDDQSAQNDLLATFRAIGKNVRGLGERFYQSHNMTPGDYRIMIMNNLSFSTMRLFSGQMDIPWSIVYKDLVSETSHISGCDVIANLEHIDAHQPDLIDGPALIFSNSAIDWVVTELTRC
ncbi:MAG: hypothetical protein J0M19_12190 [Sphingomonadales bacterium]|nr:hypothetical protein [Sphingomonadales bacterium]